MGAAETVRNHYHGTDFTKYGDPDNLIKDTM